MKPPEPIDVEIWKVKKLTLDKSSKIKREEDGILEITNTEGTTYAGVLVKDLFRDENWEKILFTTEPLYLAVHGGNCPLQIDMWYKRKWETIWSKANDFNTFAEDKKADEKYKNFIKDEGEKVARMIDRKYTFAQIKEQMSKEHSGNTWGCAFWYGISKAKNKENAQKVKEDYNKSEGGTGKEKGVINPAVIVVKVKP